MHRRYEQESLLEEEESLEEEEGPFINDNRPKKRYNWDLAKNIPRPPVSGSLEQSRYIDLSIKCLKIATIVATFLIVLGSAVISKGSILLMTSQIKPNITRLYCNKFLDKRQQYIVNHPVEERTAWIWLIVFSYMVPELVTLFRSLRIICFKTWKYPPISEFLILAPTEILPAIGSCLLIFIVFPELDVIKAAMLTNGVCLVPAIVALLSRGKLENLEKVEKVGNKLRVSLDLVSIVVQITPLVTWPLVENRPVLWLTIPSLLLTSIGWWENFTSEESKIPFLEEVAESKKKFKNDLYFMYAIIAPLKCLTFFITVLFVFWTKEGSVSFLFTNFMEAFEDHHFNVTQIKPIVGSSGISYIDAVSSTIPIPIDTSFWTPLVVFMINVVATYMCYASSKFACKIMIQPLGFALPINLVVPVLLTALISVCGKYNVDVCSYADYIPPYLFFNAPNMEDLQNFVGRQYSWVWLIWLMSQIWITVHIWSNNQNRLMPTEKIFFKPMYDAFLIDQSVAMNTRRMLVREEKETENDKIPKIYACGTMWHESKEEMVEFLKSILRMDEDQCAHRIAKDYDNNFSDYYEFETHIFFDDAFKRKFPNDPDPLLNDYVLDLIDSVDEAASSVHAVNFKIKHPVIYSTPYGGRLVWTLPGRTKMIAHLKDKKKIRAKKRWSQVMYMYYLLGFRIMNNDKYTPENIKNLAKNTYILALDGDIDFQPAAVHLLVDYMKRNETLGAACGRIHPVGSGLMVWYQIFEYAVGHWLQKATEHVIGCVLCSPGCFSLFRACALMDVNVMAKYATKATEARHYVQYDQGEDRWLCTLLLQRGYRIEYSAASDAYTHCPEGFTETYKQRRRWIPSTNANILDLLTDYEHIVKKNDNISRLYILYQVVLMIGSVLGPGTIFIMLVGAFVSAFKVSQFYSMILNLIPLLFFIIVCATSKSETQLFWAGIISALYGLIMMAVLVGIMIQITEDGWLAPSSLFLLATIGEFLIAGILHPQEFYCLKYGIIYWITIPSMYMLLVIYSLFNMNNVDWGTRLAPGSKEDNKAENKNGVEKAPLPKPAQQNKSISFFGNEKDKSGSLEFSFEGIFKMMCCSFDGSASFRPSYSHSTSRVTEVPAPAPEPSTSSAHVDAKVNKAQVDANSWYYDGQLKNSEVEFLEKEEEKFWKKFIKKHLRPIDESSTEVKKERDLKELRDKMVPTFFMLNSLFILVIFLLNLQQDIIHVNWPVGPKINFTYISDRNEILIQKTYLELQPIGLLFLFSFALLMFVQFVAMFIHRFGTYCQIMSNTNIDFSLFDQTVTDDSLEKDPIKVFKKLIKLHGMDDEKDKEEEKVETDVTRRNTVFNAAMKRKEREKPLIYDLYEAFHKRKSLILSGKLKKEPVPRATLLQIERKINNNKFKRRGKHNEFNPLAGGEIFQNLNQEDYLDLNHDRQKDDSLIVIDLEEPIGTSEY